MAEVSETETNDALVLVFDTGLAECERGGNKGSLTSVLIPPGTTDEPLLPNDGIAVRRPGEAIYEACVEHLIVLEQVFRVLLFRFKNTVLRTF